MATGDVSIKLGGAKDGWGSLKDRFVKKPKSEPENKHLWDNAAPELVVEFCRHNLGSFGKLKAKLLKCPPEWIEGFLDQGGLLVIFDSLDVLSKKGLGSFMDAVKQLECIQCIRAIMNNAGGLKFIIDSEDTQQIFAVQISKSLDTKNLLLKIQILELLSALCIYSYEGYETTVRTLQQVQKLRGLPYTFSSVMNELKHAELNDYKLTLITFINCLIISLEELEERNEVRHQFIALGLLDILDQLRNTDNLELQTQLDSFRDTHNFDLEALEQEANSLDVDIESPVEIVNRISKSLIGTQSLDHFTHILQSIFLIEQSKHSSNNNEKWRQLDNALSSVIISTINDENEMPEFEETSLMKKALKQSLMGLQVADPYTIEESVPKEQTHSETQTEIKESKTAETQTDKIDPVHPTAHPIQREPVPELNLQNYVYPTPPPNLPEVEDALATAIPDPPPNLPGVEGASDGAGNIPAPPPNMPGVGGSDETGDPRVPKPPPNMPGVKSSAEARDSPVKAKSAPAVQQKPSGKMRTLKWDKITEKDIQKKTGTLWNQIDLTKFALDTKTLCSVEEQYSIIETPKTATSKTKDKKEKTSFFDQRASMNISIFLKQFKNDNLAKIIKEGNESKISLEQMKAFAKLLPETSVVKQIKEYGGEASDLAEADTFFVEFFKLENYEMRVQILTTKLDYNSEYQELKANLEKLDRSCKEIIGNGSLRTIMGILLSLGNFINHGSYAGSAAGFKISSLGKLNDTRANKPRITLLNSLVEIVDEKYPELREFGNSMPTLEGALRLSADQLKDSVKALNSKIDQTCRKKIKLAEDLKEQVTKFLDRAEPQMEELERQANNVLDMSTEICHFYAEEAKSFKLEDFMKILHQFCKDFDKALKDNISRKEAEARKLRIEEKKKEVKNPNLRALGNVTNKNLKPDEGDIIENLMGEIKRGMTLRTVSQCRENSISGDTMMKPPIDRRKRISQRKPSERKSVRTSISSQDSLSLSTKEQPKRTSYGPVEPQKRTSYGPVEPQKRTSYGPVALPAEPVTIITMDEIHEQNDSLPNGRLKEKVQEATLEKQNFHSSIEENFVDSNNLQKSRSNNELDLQSDTIEISKDEIIAKSCENLLEFSSEPESAKVESPKKRWWGFKSQKKKEKPQTKVTDESSRKKAKSRSTKNEKL